MRRYKGREPCFSCIVGQHAVARSNCIVQKVTTHHYKALTVFSFLVIADGDGVGTSGGSTLQQWKCNRIAFPKQPGTQSAADKTGFPQVEAPHIGTAAGKAGFA